MRTGINCETTALTAMVAAFYTERVMEQQFRALSTQNGAHRPCPLSFRCFGPWLIACSGQTFPLLRNPLDESLQFIV